MCFSLHEFLLYTSLKVSTEPIARHPNQEFVTERACNDITFLC